MGAGPLLPEAEAAARSLDAAGATLPSWRELFETHTFRGGFNTNVVLVGTMLLGLAAGVVGVFALLRKRALLTDALSHATLPGIGLAFLAAAALGVDGRSLGVLLLGATASGIAGMLGVQLLLRLTRLHEDAAIGVVLSVFFGAGIVVLSIIQQDQSSSAAGLNTFIYGQAAAMRVADATLLGGIALVAVLATLLLRKEFALLAFDAEFARVDGWPRTVLDLLMMSLIVLVTVGGLRSVGLLLVVALLIVPPVAARFWTERLWVLLALAGAIGAASGYLGSVVSALLPRQPAGAVIVLVAGVFFTVSFLFAPARGLAWALARRVRLRLRIAGEHLLEAAFEAAERSGTAPALGSGATQRLAEERGWPIGLGWLVRRWLAWQGLVERRNGRLAPTAAGLARGAQVRRNHRLWEQYLVSYADVAASHVDWSVDQVEHVLSPALVDELVAALRRRGIELPAGEGAAR